MADTYLPIYLPIDASCSWAARLMTADRWCCVSYAPLLLTICEVAAIGGTEKGSRSTITQKSLWGLL